ncbi:hypothetical protein CQA61_30175, partial [Klebsiella pneumoniae]
PAARPPPAWLDGHHGAHAVALHITTLALLDDGACCANRPQPAARPPPAWLDGHHGAHAVALHITTLALLDDGA